MLHPSYTDLMKVVNKDVEEGETKVVNSRYSLVLATSKRARQIIAGSEPLVKKSRGKKPLSIAVQEVYEGKVHILPEEEQPQDEFAAEEIAAEEITAEEITE